MDARRFLPALLAAAACQGAQAETRGFIAFATPPTSNQQATDAGIDLDGDGGVDNALGSFFASTNSLGGLDFSAGVADGEVVQLIRLTSSDAAFANDGAATAEWLVGVPTAPATPDFSGAGRFSIDPAQPGGTFVAPLVASAFVSGDPVTARPPVSTTFQLAVGGRIVLPLQGARLAFTVTPSGLVSGQINGAVRAEDIDAIFYPAAADEFNRQIAAGDESAQSYLDLFDGGCNGVGADDLFITPCEVKNSVIGSILQPDLDLFDAEGQYAPNPAQTDPESLSFGMRFTASNAIVPLETVFADSFE